MITDQPLLYLVETWQKLWETTLEHTGTMWITLGPELVPKDRYQHAWAHAAAIRMDRQERVQEDVKVSAIQQVEKDYNIPAA